MTEGDIAPALAFDGLAKTFGGTLALEGFSLEVPRGGIFGLVGGNGAGKTTLIKCLLDFTQPDRGEVRIFGVSNRMTAARRDLAFLPERFNPPFYLTGRDFLKYMAQLHRVPYDEAGVAEIFERLDLAPAALTRPARTYSKGMTQKLGLAACLLSGKSLQVLDEPTSGLDPKARALLKRELKRLRESGRTIFFTSHALADVDEICDRMAVLHAGRLRFAGTPAELTLKYGSATLEDAFLDCISEAAAA
ncbi:MAG TPA: ABC transporter ATP-binding protein [Burkholderiales bacterium]|nr:ABC transporter ATP-binding protein [Burkholderiales bacterium]